MAKKKPVKKSKAKVKGRNKKKKGSGSFAVLIIAVIVIVLVIVVSKFSGGPAVKYIKASKLAEWGDSGDKKGQLSSPRGIALSPDEKFIYVSVLNSSALYKYTQDGVFVSGISGKGTKPGQFNEPSGISTDRDGNVYVADAWNGRIQKFDAKGNYKLEIGGTKGGFYSPRNVSVNKYGIVYVADTGTSRIHRFDTDGNRLGNPVGGSGKSLGKFSEVFGIAFDSKGRVYAADFGGRRIEVFSSDLAPQAQIKVKSWEVNQPLWPMLAVDSKDRLYAVSSGTQEIVVFDTTGKKIKQIGIIKNDEKDKPLFSNPLGIAVDSMDNIYITEISRNKALKIKPLFEQ
jgi:DNA-binding beta-propeller fold protein YncE